MRCDRRSLFCAAALLVPVAASAADVVFVKAGRLVIDVTEPAIPNGALVITDGIVTAAGANVTAPSGARQLDLTRFTVMPSLIDAHTHVGGPPGPAPNGRPQSPPTPAYAALRAQKNVEAALKLGVSAMRVLGTNDFLDVALMNAIEEGTIPGPHIIPGGNPLGTIGGHTDRYSTLPYTIQLTDVFTPLNGYVGSPADAEKAVQLQIKYGARVIKVMASGGVGSPLDSPGDPNLTFEEMRAAAEQAHMHHIKIAAHAQNKQSIMDAMRAGIDSIEHGSDLDQEAIDYMKSHHVTYVPTVKVGITAATRGPAPGGGPPAQAFSQFKATGLLEPHLVSFQRALKAGGVTIAAGSDEGYAPNTTGVFGELVTDVDKGMSPRAALESATIQGAKLLGLDKIGRLAPAMEADFIAVEGDPLSDIHAIERVRLVMFKGAVVTDKTR